MSIEIFRPSGNATTIIFPLIDNEGKTRTGASSLDSEWLAVSDTPTSPFTKGNVGFADMTNETTEIGTTGVYFLNIAAGELPAASPYVFIRVISGNAATQYIFIRTATVYVNTTAWNGTAVVTPNTAGVPRVDIDLIEGANVSTTTAQLGVNTVQAGGTAWGSGAITAGSIATGAIDADAIAADAIGASELATDAVAEIADAVWDEVIKTGHTTDNTAGLWASRAYFATPFSALTIGTVTTLATNAIAALSFQAGAIDATAIAAGAIDADAIAANAIGASELAADAVAEIADGIWDEVIVSGHTTDNTAGVMAQRMYFASPFSALTIGTVAAVGSGAVTTASFAAGAIDAAAIAANAVGASELAQDAAREIADEVLDRDLAGGASGGTYGIRNAFRRLRNRVQITGGNMLVFQEDDTATAYALQVTTAAGDPITEVDPIT